MSDSKEIVEKDWETADDYYKNPEKKELSLEDFVTEEDTEASFKASAGLEQTLKDVRMVLSLGGQGKTISEIAGDTGLDEKYVYNIQVCAQGFHEDDEIAVAHLVMMG